jgi:hypothetical protein
MQYGKQPLSLQEQVTLLKSRGLVFPDSEQ